MDRLDALRSMLESDPGNNFLQYALAQELVKSGDDEAAVAAFQSILDGDPDYQAAYYHSGKALQRLGRLEEASAKYREGIAASHRTGNTHARSELEAALEEIPA